MALLEVEDVSIRFGGILALDGVGFSVDNAEIVSIIGPNGAGKTTVFNCITRIYEPMRGSIRLMGRDLLKMRPPRIGIKWRGAHVSEPGIVLVDVCVGKPAGGATLEHTVQRPGRGTGVYQNREGRSRRPARGRRIPWDCWNWRRCATTPVHALPYDVKKRVEIARALVSQPKLVLLDEPAGRTDTPASRLDCRHRPGNKGRPGRGGFAGGAPDGAGDVCIRPGVRTGFRPEDCRRDTGRGTQRPGGHPNISWGVEC